VVHRAKPCPQRQFCACENGLRQSAMSAGDISGIATTPAFSPRYGAARRRAESPWRGIAPPCHTNDQIQPRSTCAETAPHSAPSNSADHSTTFCFRTTRKLALQDG
jgi:hypothetical protein